MRPGLRLAGPLVAGLVALAPAAAGGTADTLVATVPNVHHLSDYGGATAWSHEVGDQVHVAYRRGGVTHELRGSVTEVDPDLGPSRDGRSVTLVVSRCGRHGCAVESTDTRSGKTVRVQGLRRLRCAGLSSPSTWRGTIVVIGERCGRNAVDGLYVRDRAGAVRQLIGLASGSFSETDVDGAHAAVTDSGDSSVRIVALRTGRSRMVWQGEESASFSDAPGSPGLDGRIVFWLETAGAVGRATTQWLGAAPATVRPTKTCQRQQLPAINLAIAIADRRLLYSTADAILRGAGTVSCVATRQVTRHA
jgi:hypothetical protein